jgi:hypothetical protein
MMAERFLVLAVPIINLCLLAIATVLLPAFFGETRIILVSLSLLYAITAFGVAKFG